MKLPNRYNEVRGSLPTAEVSYGCGGIKLFSAAELEEGQVGYSVAPDGTSLCSREAGAWQPHWLVVGCETACGDPLFIDFEIAASPVFTAMHGAGTWEPARVAASVETFAKCLEAFSHMATRRSTPVEREANPLSDEERLSFLRRIAQLNETSGAPEFWDFLLEG